MKKGVDRIDKRKMLNELFNNSITENCMLVHLINKLDYTVLKKENGELYLKEIDKNAQVKSNGKEITLTKYQKELSGFTNN
ncbi:MAG: hypothetical protein ACOCRX_10880 [Candidatus Woesearchaeota archaeon]